MIITPKWIEDSKKANCFVDESKYTLIDKDSEAASNFSLKTSLSRARASPLMEGLSFYLSPQLKDPPVADLKEIIVASCGKVLSHAFRFNI